METADGASRKERKHAGFASSSQSDPESRKRRKKEPRGGGGSGEETGKGDAGEGELDVSQNPVPQIVKSSRSKKRTDKGKEIDGSSASASFVMGVSSRSDKKAKEDVYGVREKASERNDGENKEHPSSDGCGKEKEKKPIASSSVVLDERSRSRRYKRAKEVPLVGNVANQQEVCDVGQKGHGSLSVEGNCENKKLHGSMASTSSKGEMVQEKTQKKKKKSILNATEALQGQTEGISINGDGKSGFSRSILKGGLKSANSHRSGNGKKVAFSDHNTVFPISSDDKHAGNECKLIVGKRYTKEEDQIFRDALIKTLKARGFEWEDGYKIYDRDPSLRGFWKEIYIHLPWRTHDSIRVRSENLFLGTWKGNWTQEEIELLKRYRDKHGKGTPWRGLCGILNRHRHHIKDTWRRNKLPNGSKGYWSAECQKLFDLVNMDLRMKAFEKKDVRIRNLMVRDNISWTAISDDAIGTKSHPNCCLKWYNQLTSPMVSQGLWSDCDDYHLVGALSKLDASCAEDVDWDVLVEGRSADFCRKRWKEMTRHIGGKKESSFMEQVGLLSTLYCKDMLEYRTGDVKEL